MARTIAHDITGTIPIIKTEKEFLDRYKAIVQYLGYYGIQIPPYEQRHRISMHFIESLFNDSKLTDLNERTKSYIIVFFEACLV